MPVEQNRIIFMYVAEMDEELLGYVVWEENVTEGIGHILNVAVKTERRKEGLGTALMNHAFDTLRSHKINSCRLEVRQSNNAARRLYERAGMTAEHEESRYYGDEDAIIYSIKL